MISLSRVPVCTRCKTPFDGAVYGRITVQCPACKLIFQVNYEDETTSFTPWEDVDKLVKAMKRRLNENLDTEISKLLLALGRDEG
jgi:hypothetical protein